MAEESKMANDSNLLQKIH